MIIFMNNDSTISPPRTPKHYKQQKGADHNHKRHK